MKIGVFGGAFDPPHNGHNQVASALIAQKKVDEVWFVPVFTHPWADRYQKKHMAEYAHRVQMIKQVLGKKQRLKHFRQVSFTYDTLQYFSSHYPQHTFFWIMGSEYLARFSDFLKVHPKLLDYQMFIYPRAGSPLEQLYPNMTPVTGVEEVTVSSTQVRELLRAGESVTNLVHPDVAQYCLEHKLYI